MENKYSELLSLTKPHIEAFDAFTDVFPKITNNLPSFEYNDDNGSASFSFIKLELLKPYVNDRDTALEKRIFPKDCRLKSTTYKGKLIADIEFKVHNKRFTIKKSLGYIPIMLKSKYCHTADFTELQNIQHGDESLEVGGYFVINGNDKVVRLLIAQKRNHIFTLIRDSNIKKGKNFTEFATSIRCVSDDETGQVNFLHYTLDGNIIFRFYIRKREFQIPLVLLLRALVNTTDKEIFDEIIDTQHITNDLALNVKRIKNMLASFREFELYTQEDCLDYIGSKFKPLFTERDYTNLEAAQFLLSEHVAVHLNDNYDKFKFLLLAVKKLYRLVDNKRVDNPDSQMNHEIMTITQIFASILKERMLDAGRLIKRLFEKSKGIDEDEINKIVKSNELNVCNKFEMLLATGNLNLTMVSDITETAGFSVIAERINYYRFFSHFRSVNRGNFFAQLKTTTVRKLKPESWGFFCPVHTPDGTPCGIITHLTHQAQVIVKKDKIHHNHFFDLGLLPLLRGQIIENKLDVILDGQLIGIVHEKDSFDFVEKLRKLRASKGYKFEVVFIPKDDHIESLYPGIYLSNGLGRLARPVFNSKNNIEYIGIMEQVFLRIKSADTDDSENNVKIESDFKQGNNMFAPYKEIDTTGFLSVVAGLTPFSDFNQSPRNMYQCQMAKQTMGTAFYNLKYRTDNKAYQITYPQLPIVKTQIFDDYNLEEYPMGINAVVAVLAYTAYDMEDAMVINKSSMERGFFYGSIYKTEVVEIEREDKVIYTPEIGSYLKNGDLFYRLRKGTGEKKNILYKGFDSGFIDSVIFYDTGENSGVAFKVKLRIPRNPSIGDKFCSRHGQKGVCSMHWPSIDMPFTEDGIVPDIIINPHAFPSRMTIGMLVESMAGKSGCLDGKTQDGTAFQFKQKVNGAVEAFGEELHKNGYNYYGNETMYSGVTGSEFNAEVFIGVVYYQRLRHMVSDKFQMRTTGSINTLTRQPIGGRKKKGGVRFGEMERDAIISHGCSMVLKDRLMNCSDVTTFLHCDKCKSILFTDEKRCLCDNKQFKEVELPYVFKFLCSELLSMNVRVKIELD